MKKALNIAKTIFVWLMVALAVFMMIFTIVSVTTFDRADRNLFGYKTFIVLSDSMSKTDFNAGDIVFVKGVDASTLKEGDIISYASQNSHNFGETVIHKIRRLTSDAEGNPGFVTYGTTTDTDDETVVTYPYVLGKYTGHLPKVGAFFQFLKTTPGYIVCILTPFLLLILLQGLNCIKLFRRYKQEQLDEMQAEREKIEAERLQSQKMMQELLALKQQLEEKENSIETSSKVEELN
ncbi:MAG: signal peptidase I [Caldicoprobacterales bacterium]|jgi:signal peptidase I